MLSERLLTAISHAGYSIRRAAAYLSEDREIAGASYSQLRRVLDGSTAKPPTLEFVEEVADALGVRRAWLAFGDGEMTEADQAAKDSAAQVAARFDEQLREVRQGIMDGLGIPSEEEAERQFSEDERPALHRMAGLRLSVLPAIDLNVPPETLGQMVRADFDELGRDPLELTPEELDDYLVVRFGALLACLAYPRSSVLW